MLSACNNSGNDSSALYQSLIGSASADVESETTQTDDITIASAAIEVLTGNQKSERKIFKDGETLILGRDVSCQLVFDGSYKYVSREHCSVLFDYKQGGFHYSTDLEELRTQDSTVDIPKSKSNRNLAAVDNFIAARLRDSCYFTCQLHLH